MGLKTLDLPPFDHILNTLDCVVHCGHPMRRQPVISEFEVAISKKCPMNPGFTLVYPEKSLKVAKRLAFEFYMKKNKMEVQLRSNYRPDGSFSTLSNPSSKFKGN